MRRTLALVLGLVALVPAGAAAATDPFRAQQWALGQIHATQAFLEPCTGMLLNLALSYSGRAELVDAVRRMVADARKGAWDPARVDDELLASYLYTAGLPDPDLLIRTSGEMRLSNFMLWQLAYTELWITDTLWPDFRRRHLFQAVAEFQGRERRFGRSD